jgi:hypothetical protein
MYTYSIDISRKSNPIDSIPAILVISSTKELEVKDALGRFRRSVSQWLANTEQGKMAWEKSGYTFNYGDFITEDVACRKHFLRFLYANGLSKAEVKYFEAEDCGEYWDRVIKPETV